MPCQPCSNKKQEFPKKNAPLFFFFPTEPQQGTAHSKEARWLCMYSLFTFWPMKYGVYGMEYHSTSIHMVIGLLYIGALATSFMPISILILSGLSLPWGPSQHYRAESIG